jgi:hypothetical protein
LVSILIFEVGSLLCGAAPSSKALIVGRAFVGVGVGGIFSGALIISAYAGSYLVHLDSLNRIVILFDSPTPPQIFRIWDFQWYAGYRYRGRSPSQWCPYRSSLMALVFLYQVRFPLISEEQRTFTQLTQPPPRRILRFDDHLLASNSPTVRFK